MWQHRKGILISFILILSLAYLCLRKREENHSVEQNTKRSKMNLCLDKNINKTNIFYIFCWGKVSLWISDNMNSISTKSNKIAKVIHDKGVGKNQKSGDKQRGKEDINNGNSENSVIISCILWLLFSLGKACLEMRDDLKERKNSTPNSNISRKLSLQNFTFSSNKRKSFGTSKFCRRSTIESIQPITSFETNYELMRANEAHRILNMSSLRNSPILSRRSSVPVSLVKQIPRQLSLGGQIMVQRQLSEDSGSTGSVDRSPEVKRRMRLIYRH